AIQILLSASNFIVGLLLIRRTSNVQYGLYVLVTTSIALSSAFQSAFIQPPTIIRLTRAGAATRADLVGGLYRDQNRVIPLLAAATLIVTAILYLTGHLTMEVLAVAV